jgi:hypothetical protein
MWLLILKSQEQLLLLSAEVLASYDVATQVQLYLCSYF